MGTHAPITAGDSLVKPSDLMLSVCDRSSPFHRESIEREAWAYARRFQGQELWALNQFFSDEMIARRAVTWILVLLGVFRLRVVICPDPDSVKEQGPIQPFVGPCQEAVLDCPSGELGWVDLYAKPPTWTRIATVPPGRYRCWLMGVENPAHWVLASPAQYPAEDSDWALCLFRLSDLPATAHPKSTPAQEPET